jgi:hypothetical protein
MNMELNDKMYRMYHWSAGEFGYLRRQSVYRAMRLSATALAKREDP